MVMRSISLSSLLSVIVGLDPVFGEGTNGWDEGTGAVGTGVGLGDGSHDYVFIAR